MLKLGYVIYLTIMIALLGSILSKAQGQSIGDKVYYCDGNKLKSGRITEINVPMFNVTNNIEVDNDLLLSNGQYSYKRIRCD